MIGWDIDARLDPLVMLRYIIMGTGKEYTKTIVDAIYDQSPTIDGWICKTCVNYEGPLKCKFNIFIAFVGANMAGCRFHQQGMECRHCHKFT